MPGKMRMHPGLAKSMRPLEIEGEQADREAKRAQQMEAADMAALAADAALTDPALTAAFARLEADYTAAWRNSDPLRPDLREAAYHKLRALTELQADLSAAAASARLTRRNLRLDVKPTGEA